jgi:hypothetical protein
MPAEDFLSQLIELSARMKEFERRLSFLEHSLQVKTSREETLASPASDLSSPAESPAAQSQSSVLSVFGRAVLGIAGAYILRAVAESGIFPPWIVVTLALPYAAAWLSIAAWPSTQTSLARYTYAITAALILSPMLWEVTVDFHFLAPPVTAAVLVAFALLATILGRLRKIFSIAWVGMLTAVITAFVLMVATRAVVPFTLALLAMALLSELGGGVKIGTGLRPAVAAAADAATLIVLIILGDSRAIPPEYHPVAPGSLIILVASLFAIYAASIAIRSLILRLKVTAFEAAQLTATTLLAGWGILRITDGAGLLALGIFCLLLGTACYLAAFGLLASQPQGCNFHFYMTCAVVFVIAGSYFTLPFQPLVIWLCLAAVFAMGLGLRIRNPALASHGVVYLGGAAAVSDLFLYAGRALAGSFPPLPGALLIVVTGTALLCTAIVSRYPGEHLGERLLRLLPAILLVYATAAIMVAALVWLMARAASPSLPQLAAIRTVVTCAAALLLVRVGTWWKQQELVWMAYAVVVLGSVKLIFEDLRFGSALSLATSLLIYGAILILIPRLARAANRHA